MAYNAQQVAKAAHAAADRIGDIVRLTPLVHSPALSVATGGGVYLKLENLQHTGSFKFRGAMNRLLTLSEGQRSRGCVAASSGNHGAAVAFAMQRLGVAGIIFVPEQTSPAKVGRIIGATSPAAKGQKHFATLWSPPGVQAACLGNRPRLPPELIRSIL